MMYAFYPTPMMLLAAIEIEYYVLSVLGYVIVLLVLLLLFLVFSNIPAMLRLVDALAAYLKRKPHAEASPPSSPASERVVPGMSGEESAAIAAAVYLFLEEQHDDEDMRLTIQEISRRYSPWSSKIHGIMNTPNRRTS